MSSHPICLNMIVKNEAAILEDCLRSVLPVIDYFVICDTGSSDQTIPVIEAFAAQHGLKGEIHRIPFVNFAVTRNHALDLCRRSSDSFESILLTDADMELIVQDKDFGRDLSAPAYMMRQSNDISYYNTRLLRRDCPAHYIGATHEYLATEAAPQRLTGLWFIDHARGSNRAEKFTRDIGLLTADLQRDPANPRTMFYLAQTYMDAGRHDEAIAWYEKRIAVGGWEEEVWYSMYRIAQCHAQRGDVERFRAECLRAHRYRSSRSEPLFSLANHYRLAGDYEESCKWCEAAAAIPYPTSDILFIQDYVYHAGIQEEMSIAGFYCEAPQQRDKGYEACLALTTSRRAGPAARANAVRNFYYYLKSAVELFPGFEARELAVPGGTTWPGTNPSIWIDDNGRHCILRTVNYLVSGATYHHLDRDQIYRTKNYVLTLDDRFKVRESKVMEDLGVGPPRHPFPVEGFEDCRLFRCRGRLWCTCTVRDRHPAGRCQIALLGLDDQYNVVEMNLLQGIGDECHQKNWVPVAADDSLFLIYTTDPTLVLEYDFERKIVRNLRQSVPSACLELFRGNSQAVRTPAGWLYMTHEAQQVDERTKSYQHRFVALTNDFHIKAFTEPFYFVAKGIEFCAGLAYDGNTDRLIASFGVNDCGAYLGFFDLNAVCARLRAA